MTIMLIIVCLEGALALYFLLKWKYWETRCKSCEKHFRMIESLAYYVWRENWKDFKQISDEEEKEYR